MPSRHKLLMTKSRKYMGRIVKIRLINGYTLVGKITKVKSGGIFFTPLRKTGKSRMRTSFLFFPIFIPFAAILFIKFIIF
ncbi:hypothetical protein [Thermoactinomyces mirandus]|uniref:Uncharacterized protein n=1 Tax=Thermoactinomyces mirandus TaxID=2756294 RepID=A0A7W2AQ71_9BACL|nr:hypothetical protein [Thermoactinomyces mirandus]MBA4600982.1 hypothetical protein [Thermoactinomyces mirandus]